ncbi:RNA polymerase sigma factor [Dyella sedimenti]|uniref:RNA polymerase sigma factor n=1 Tax=Dyella sedimenti TaxID=2919947 RepID=UPI001FAB1941|nr:sigma-70 family RNA polymerase sigma factor [Dyella sedimenti]
MECGTSDGSDEQFEQAWRAHHPMLLRRARRLTGGHPDRADELLAATALKALQFMRHRPRFMEHPKGFLFVVLRHVFVDGLRRSAREGQVFDDSVDLDGAVLSGEGNLAPSAMQRLELLQQIARVEAVLHAMSPEQRRLFAFRFIDDLPYPQIAERLGVNQPLLRKRVQLIRDRLRAEVGQAAPPRRGSSRPPVFTNGGGERYDKSSGARRNLPTPPNKGHRHG